MNATLGSKLIVFQKMLFCKHFHERLLVIALFIVVRSFMPGKLVLPSY